MDTAEQTIETVNDIAEAVVPEVTEAVEAVRNNPILLVGVGLLGVIAGAAAGYFFARKRLGLEYEERLNKEIADTHRHYALKHKVGEYATPAEAREVFGVGDESELVVVEEEKGIKLDIPETTTDYAKFATVPKEATLKVENIFLNGEAVDSDFDYEAEAATRSEDAPYIITSEEFDENESDYEQIGLSYFALDDVLANSDSDDVVDSVDSIVGVVNLQRFGHGSKDSNILYIRNDQEEALYEIARIKGKFAKLVLGFDDEDLEDFAPLRFRNRD